MRAPSGSTDLASSTHSKPRLDGAPVEAVVLFGVHVQIGFAHQRLGTRIGVVVGCSHGARDIDASAVPENGLGVEHHSNLLSAAHSIVQVRVDEQGRELVAPDPSHDILFTGVLGQQPRDGLQDPVASLMPMGVVDLLEVVEVDEDQDTLLVLGARGRKRGFEVLVETTPVEHTSHLVAFRQRLELSDPRRLSLQLASQLLELPFGTAELPVGITATVDGSFLVSQCAR